MNLVCQSSTYRSPLTSIRPQVPPSRLQSSRTAEPQNPSTVSGSGTNLSMRTGVKKRIRMKSPATGVKAQKKSSPR